MHLKQRLSAFVSLGKFIHNFLHSETVDSKDNHQINELSQLVQNVHLFNTWFTPESVKLALSSISEMLKEKNLESWLVHYPQLGIIVNEPKHISVIMAGNIPMVGFHDALCVLLTGHKLIAKLSSDDDKLIPFLWKVLTSIEPEFIDYCRFEEGIVKNADAFIATGSNNSARYFEHYFDKYPHIIRKNRSSISILTGRETDEELVLLGKDVFYYFGLGCRNVSLLLIPEGFSLVKLLDNFQHFEWLAKHNKYMNNYDYRRSIALLNQTHHLDNGFLLLFENNSIHAPIGTLHYTTYTNQSEADKIVTDYADQLQCIVGNPAHCNVAFGQVQFPANNDYADGVDTLQFLLSLHPVKT